MAKRLPSVVRVRGMSGCIGALAVAAVATAQAVPAPPLRGQRLVTVTTAAANEYVGCGAVHNGLSPARDGSLFVLVTRTVFAGADRTGAATSDLELWRSTDGGGSWARAASTSTRGDSDGALVATDDGMAVTWTATDGESWSSVWFQRFDVASGKWVGGPERLARGRGEEDQYFCSDIGCTASGALVVALGSHRSPPAPWTCGWSTGMRWLASGAASWSDLVQVNGEYYGVMGNLIVRGDQVDFTYRTNPGWSDAVHGVRAFDAKTGAFVAATETVPIAAAENSSIANTGILVADDAGGRTLLHVLAGEQPGHGRLAVSFARPGEAWKTVDVADDPPLAAGNLNPTHFTLARGPGNQVFAYFAKLVESYANLWQCTIEDGALASPPKVVARGEAGSFLTVDGMRASGCFSGLHVATTSRTAQQPGGVVSVFGSWPARTVWARAAK